MSFIIDILIIGLIVNIVIIAAIVIALLSFKYHLAITVISEYKYNNNQLLLSELLFYNYDLYKNIYMILSERESIDFDKFKTFIEEKTKIFLGDKEFKITNETTTLVGNESVKGREGYVYIFRPYEYGMVEKIVLVTS
ncbi:MAG: hypothetical protein QXI09_00790 [Candidatus Aenigmatarchaeota archaeon]